MWQIVLGSLGFLLYFMYDINSIQKKKNVILQKFFAAGTVLVVVSLIMELLHLWGQCQHSERMPGKYNPMLYILWLRMLHVNLRTGKKMHPAHP